MTLWGTFQPSAYKQVVFLILTELDITAPEGPFPVFDPISGLSRNDGRVAPGVAG